MFSERVSRSLRRRVRERATVETLKMNRLEQVNIRMALRALRRYPPEIG